MTAAWKVIGSRALDLLFPPLCLSCRAPVGSEGGFCAACLARPPAFTCARAILVYDAESRGAILALKHADRLELVPGFARWLGRVGAPLLDQADLIVPVPLHRSRLWLRRYNQSAELARRLARDWNRVYDPLALIRGRRTPSQGVMPSARARRKNVLSAFRVPDPERIRGRRILLVDDVLTTGATAQACARALKRAGAADITVLTLARVVKASEAII